MADLELLTFKLETMIDKSTDLQDTPTPAITYSECYAQPLFTRIWEMPNKNTNTMLKGIMMVSGLILLSSCNQPQEIKEDPNKAYKDSIQRRIDSCQAVIDSVELEKKKLGL